ncbi:MAG: DUF342 domain-containing protein [Planctomycetes bacterium]|nr:DUF342 domain-containing protein [Planctomycetota bacterium]
MLIDLAVPLRVGHDVSRQGGEVFYPGDVLVEGNVHGGFCLRAGGSLTVLGNVELASLQAGGDIVVRGSVTGGSNSFLDAGRDVRLSRAYNLSVRAAGDVEITGGVEISRCAAGGQLTMLGGAARDCQLSALKGLWLTDVRCSAPRATILTAGRHFAFQTRRAALERQRKEMAGEQQEQLNALAPLLRKAATDSATRKKNAHDLEARMYAADECEYFLSRLDVILRELEAEATRGGVAAVVCEERMEKGCQIVLGVKSQPLPATIAGPFTLVVNAAKQTIGKLAGAQLLRKRPG